ncbi:MAG: glycoside hydrolase family 28 protein [Saprospiraceae bacterium]
MKKISFVLFVFFCLTTVLNAKDYNIISFGAVPDGSTLNTVAIQKAINEAYENGGGRVVVPTGTFLCGSIILKTGVEFHLQENAILLGSTQIEDYQKLKRWKALVLADGQRNISITGKGTLDGQGRQLALNIDSLFYIGQIDSTDYTFPEKRPREYLRPQIIEFVKCKNIKITGVTVQNAASWVQTYDLCENLIIDNIRVLSDAYWNNDGIDIGDCRNVRITNCHVNSADDGICLKSHYIDKGCDSIYIANCTVRSSASAIKFGTRSSAGFKNITIENIKVFDTFRSAIAIESVDGGTIENVLVNNIKATNTGNAIFIRLAKRSKVRPAGKIKNVTLRNIKAEICFERPDYAYDIRGPNLPFFHNIFPASITGIPGNSVENVVLENIEIIYPGRGNNGLANMPVSRLEEVPEKVRDYPEFSMFGELPAWGLYVRHVDELTMRNIRLEIKAPDYRPAFVFDDVKKLKLKTVKTEGDQKDISFFFHKVESVERTKK